MPLPSVSAALLAAAAVTAPEAGSSRVLRFPDICGDAVTFVQAGDIYRVSAAGGVAQRLTSHPGNELYPKFSPDCRSIAFSAEYDGTRQVYVIPAEGGLPRQLTWYNDVGPMPPRGGTDYRVLDWSPDGKHVLLRANRVPYDERSGRLYQVPADGGLETPLPMPESGGGMFSPDGKSVVYTPIDREFRSWKRYRGGRAQDVWTYDLANNSSRRLTETPATDHQPMWLGDTVYFVSDRDGQTLNLWAMPAQGGEARQLTRYTDFDILWPSAGKDGIVFEQGGWIWRFNPADGQTAKLDIRVSGDQPQALPAWKKVAGQVESFDLSPHGERAVFGARGELFTVPAKNGEVRNLSRTPQEREISASWSPDGRRIAYLSDASGEYEIYVREQDGSGEPRRLTRDGGIWRFAPVWSPDSKKLAYADKQQRLRIVDVDSGSQREVDRGQFDDITDYSWAPDSNWLAYSRANGAGLSEIWLYSLADGKTGAVTEATSNAFNPAFDPKGRWLYFLSTRDYNLTFSAFEQNYLYTNATRPYALALAADAPALYPLKSDEVRPAAAEPEKPAKEEKPAPVRVRVDRAGITARVTAFKVAAGNYQSLRAGGDAIYFLSGVPRQQQPLELRRAALDADADKSVAANIGDYRVSASGDTLLLKQGDRYAIVKAEAAQDFGAGALNLDRMELYVDPRVEWKQEFTDAWRILRDWFYDPGVHGGIERWNKVRDSYAAWVPHLGSRADLDYLLQEIAGEANSGHVYVQSAPDMPKVERRPGGLLGADFAADASGYFRIAHIFAGENWNRDQRSPLTEAGVDAKAGDFLIAVDGVDARSVKNPYQLLQGRGDQVVSLRLNSRPSAAGAREVRVRTLTSEQSLRYADWVASRRALVDKLSNGRVGYIHVPNTAVEGNRELNKGLLAYHDKEALIIDDRYNGGGFIPDRMIELLARTPLNYWKRRGLDPAPTPLVSHDGPKAMLINGLSSSGGDAFPYYFRKLKLGTLIGTRTWGGLIGISGNPGLADGGSLLAATFRFMSTEGEWKVENEGVAPDIEVIDRPELIAAGKDPSIEKAVEVLLGQLPATPRPRLQAPPAPTNFGG